MSRLETKRLNAEDIQTRAAKVLVCANGDTPESSCVIVHPKSAQDARLEIRLGRIQAHQSPVLAQITQLTYDRIRLEQTAQGLFFDAILGIGADNDDFTARWVAKLGQKLQIPHFIYDPRSTDDLSDFSRLDKSSILILDPRMINLDRTKSALHIINDGGHSLAAVLGLVDYCFADTNRSFENAGISKISVTTLPAVYQAMAITQWWDGTQLNALRTRYSSLNQTTAGH